MSKTVDEVNWIVDPSIKEFASQRGKEYIDAVNELGSTEKAGDRFGVSGGTVRSAIRRARRKAAKTKHNVEEGHSIRRISTNTNGVGELTSKWVIEGPEGVDPDDADFLPKDPDARTLVKQSRQFDGNDRVIGYHLSEKPTEIARVRAWEAFAREVVQKIEPLEPVPAPKVTDSDLCTMYVLTDCHLGMLAWGEETGDDWDIRIAEQVIINAMADMLERSPDSEQCVIAQLGDFLHYDSLEAVTPTSRHILDSDTRFQKLVRVGLRVLNTVLQMALKKHKRVYFLNAEGNHDMAASAVFRESFALLYQDDPRIEVETNPSPYYSFQWGSTMLFFHHGHKNPPAKMPAIASNFASEMWGASEYRYAHTGDKHHKEVIGKDDAGMIVEQHGILPPSDGYAIRGGWKSQRYATSITYHKDQGEWVRAIVRPRTD